MYSIYRVLLFIAYFGILVYCQGGGGGGRGGGGRGGGGGRIGGSGGGYYGGSGSNCTTAECQQNTSMSMDIIIKGIGGLLLLVFGTIVCCDHCRGRPLHKNSTFVSRRNSKIREDLLYGIDIFQSGIWSSRYFQYSRWYGPHQISLTFDLQSMQMTGSGSDDVGRFTVNGICSMQTHRIGFVKHYEVSTGNLSENLGHHVIIQLTRNAENARFEGKWYVQTSRYRGEDKFELKFNG